MYFKKKKLWTTFYGTPFSFTGHFDGLQSTSFVCFLSGVNPLKTTICKRASESVIEKPIYSKTCYLKLGLNAKIFFFIWAISSVQKYQSIFHFEKNAKFGCSATDSRMHETYSVRWVIELPFSGRGIDQEALEIKSLTAISETCRNFGLSQIGKKGL